MHYLKKVFIAFREWFISVFIQQLCNTLKIVWRRNVLRKNGHFQKVLEVNLQWYKKYEMSHHFSCYLENYKLNIRERKQLLLNTYRLKHYKKSSIGKFKVETCRSCSVKLCHKKAPIFPMNIMTSTTPQVFSLQNHWVFAWHLTLTVSGQ